MGTILRNSPWHETTEVIKGDYGEELVREILEDCGFVVYQAVTDAPHPIDFIVARDKEFIFAVDVKTKPRMQKYAETGFNYSHYEAYRDYSAKEHMPVLIVWVDEITETIYGNFLSVLDEPRVSHGIEYPKTMRTRYDNRAELIRYYPLCAMLPIGNLSADDVAFLKSKSQSLY